MLDAMLQVATVLGLILCGVVARRRGMISDAGAADLSRLMLSLLYPAAIFVSVTRLDAADLAANAAVPALVAALFLLGFGVGALALRLAGGLDGRRARAFLFLNTVNNYVFLPLPIVLMSMGERGAGVLFLSSLGAEIVLWTLGIYLFVAHRPRAERRRHMLGAPMVTLLVAVALVIARDRFGALLPEGLPGAGVLREAGRRAHFGMNVLGQAVVAVSALAAGSRIATLAPRTMLDARIWLVAALRLVVTPAIAVAALRLLPLEPVARGVLTVVAAMPCAIQSVIFSERFDGDGEFIAGSVLLTHLLAIATVPLALRLALG